MPSGIITGKTNIPIKEAKYSGLESETAYTIIDNKERTIKVDVKVDEVTKDCATKEELSYLKEKVTINVGDIDEDTTFADLLEKVSLNKPFVGYDSNATSTFLGYLVEIEEGKYSLNLSDDYRYCIYEGFLQDRIFDSFLSISTYITNRNIKYNCLSIINNYSLTMEEVYSNYASGGAYINYHTSNGEFIYFINFTGYQTDTKYQISIWNNKGSITKYVSKNSTLKNVLDSITLIPYEITYNKVTSLSSSSTDTQYPSAKAVYNFVKDEPNLIEITWANLKSLRDNGELIPGRFYRINDYQCTTTQANTSSAGHVFDIIVRADDEHTLNENAQAMLHCPIYDVTFSDVVIKKCYVSTTGNSNEYNLVDIQTLLGIEAVHEAECSVFDTVNKIIVTDTYPSSELNESNLTYDYFQNCKLSSWQLKYCLDNDTNRFDWADSTNGKGVIYRMIDEFNNDCPYDFKNILFTKTNTYTNAYTFSYTEDSTIKDASILGISKSCYSNVMKKHISSNKQRLNFNVFYSISTTFDCYDNTFGNICQRNTFGNYCYNNTFGNDCFSNTFENVCNNNTFGNYCEQNTFGSNCSNNTFGTYCRNNTFGNYCGNNTFENNCGFNTFGNGCSSNTFGNICQRNTFGNYCGNNTFGNNCEYITFGDSSSAMNNYQYNIFDSGCQYLYIIGNGASFNYLQNFYIHSGVKGTSSSNRKTITIDRNLSYTTDVYPVGSTEMFI